jgi:hypothetical protein
MATRIFLWAFPALTWDGDFIGFAMDENGQVLAQHISSSMSFSQHDLGLTSEWKHDRYKEAHPGGYELVWVDDPDSSAEFQAAFAKNLALLDAAADDEAVPHA